MFRRHLIRFLVGLLLVGWIAPVTGAWASETTAVSLSSGPFTMIHMLSTKIGWGLTNTSVLKTADGGVTWTDVTPAEAGQLQSSSVYFMDALHAWVATGKNELLTTIYCTKDGGGTWQQTAFPAEETMAVQFQFLNSRVGWLMAHQGVAMSHERVTFYHTVDGGKNWARVSNTDSHDSRPGRLPFGGDKFGFGFRDERVGFVAGTEPVSGWVYLYITRDGGRTWWKANLPILKQYTQSQFCAWTPVFFNNKEGVIPVSLGGDRQPTVFYATQDGGKKWTTGKVLTSQGNQRFIWSLMDVKHWVATDGDTLYSTADGGQSWRTTRLHNRLADLTQLDFATPQVGWALVNGNIDITTDGGSTWVSITEAK